MSRNTAKQLVRRDRSSDIIWSTTNSEVNRNGMSDQGITLGYLIHDVSRMRKSTFDQIMKPQGFTRSHWWVLACLSRQDGMVQTQLANVLETGKASLGALLRSLDKAGMIKRISDPMDKRSKRVFLTSTAHRIVRKMKLAEDHLNDEILSKLSQEERDRLINLLTQIKTSLIELDRKAQALKA